MSQELPDDLSSSAWKAERIPDGRKASLESHPRFGVRLGLGSSADILQQGRDDTK